MAIFYEHLVGEERDLFIESLAESNVYDRLNWKICFDKT